jgi:hypothetical protein
MKQVSTEDRMTQLADNQYMVEKSVFSKDELLLALQPVLAKFFVQIESCNSGFIVTFEQRPSNLVDLPTEAEFASLLVEAAFIHSQAQATMPLRKMLLKYALEGYKKQGV